MSKKIIDDAPKNYKTYYCNVLIDYYGFPALITELVPINTMQYEVYGICCDREMIIGFYTIEELVELNSEFKNIFKGRKGV